jgi:hypothetical protein
MIDASVHSKLSKTSELSFPRDPKLLQDLIQHNNPIPHHPSSLHRIAHPVTNTTNPLFVLVRLLFVFHPPKRRGSQANPRVPSLHKSQFESHLASHPIAQHTALPFIKMAAEVSSMPNGSYAPQHGFDQQQANNAYASQNYNQAPAASSNSASTATPQPEIPKDEVGWYFVEQYYTTLSRTPEKLYVSCKSIGIKERALADA